MINRINFLFVTLFGIGKIKKIPGSLASLSTILFLFFLFHILNISPNIVLFSVIIIFFIALYAVSVFIKDLPNKDPKEVVIDEFIGQSIPICLYEVAHNTPKETDQIFKFYFICLFYLEFLTSQNLFRSVIMIRTLRIVLVLLWMMYALSYMLLPFLFYIWCSHEKTF